MRPDNQGRLDAHCVSNRPHVFEVLPVLGSGEWSAMSERQQGTYRKGFGEMDLVLLDALNRAGIDAKWGEPMPTGEDSSRVPDLLVPVTPGLYIVPEVMGKGSKSDSYRRHVELLSHGMFPLYFDNQHVKHCPELCVRQIRQTRATLRSMLP